MRGWDAEEEREGGKKGGKEKSFIIKVLLEKKVCGEIFILLAGEVGLNDQSLREAQRL